MQGIYKIINKINGKIYIGSSKNITTRWGRHISELYTGCHGNEKLQVDFKNHGMNALTFEILEIVKDTNKLLNKEQEYIYKTKSYLGDIGYNVVVNTKINTTTYEKCEEKVSIKVDELYNVEIDKEMEIQLKKNMRIIEVGDIFKESTVSKFSHNSVATKRWLQDKANAEETRKLILNYAVNIKKLKTNDLYWCTFCGSQEKLQNKGYIKSFIPLNSTISKKRNNLIYAVNSYYNSFTQQSLETRVDNKKFALSVALKWIIGVADIGQPIEIFVISKRMVKILKDWQNASDVSLMQ